MARRTGQLKCPSDALTLVQQATTEAPLLAGLKLCYKQKDSTTAIEMFRTSTVIRSDAARKATIQVCAHAGQYDAALTLLTEQPTIACLNAVLAKHPDSVSLLHVYSNMTTTFSYNVVLKQLARNSQSATALELLHAMDCPDQCSYHSVLLACFRNNDGASAMNVYSVMEKLDLVNKQTRQLVGQHTSSYSQHVRWDENDQNFPKIKLPGKLPYWLIGTFQRDNGSFWNIAIQPNKNPRRNGCKLLVLNNNNNTKVAHVLLSAVPSAVNKSETTSAMVGMHIAKEFRKLGYTRDILGVWLDICRVAGVRPQTTILRKPLLCLVLQHHFNFSSLDNGVDVEVYPGIDSIKLYSSKKSLGGVFSPSAVQQQGLELCTTKPIGEGRHIRINGKLLGPEKLPLNIDCFLHVLDQKTARRLLLVDRRNGS